jgi:diaminopimelate epimerase
MLDLSFYKYQGTGNDFILVNQMLAANFPKLSTTNIQNLCHRHLGIGADGIILLRRNLSYDFEMLFFNPDGSQSFCGNGSRCAVHWAHQRGFIDKKATFLAIDGPHNAWIEDDWVYVYIKDVSTIEPHQGGYFVHTGSPHYVCLTDQLEGIAIDSLGKAINQHEQFQKSGTNVNFVELKPNNQIAVRTYERGVFAETLSCGSGVVAAALVAAQEAGYMSPISIQTRGGELEVGFNKQTTGYSSIYLAGPAVKVFEGHCSLNFFPYTGKHNV